MDNLRPVLALSGGVGGAKLAVGLLHVLPPDTLSIIANTGDDFDHLGLHVSPDVDTLLYALSGRDDPVRGWGRLNETWHFMEALEETGEETWFRLGDRDLATHVVRMLRLSRGETLTQVTASFAHRFGISAAILPMSDDRVRTRLQTSEGWMDFQPWFVGCRAEPSILSIHFDGADSARLPIAIGQLVRNAKLRAIVICPSNPLISIDPILSVSALRAALIASNAPVIAVCPLIGGRALKGPTAKMMADLGIEPGVPAIIAHYGDLIDGIIVDEEDAEYAENRSTPVVKVAPIVMSTLADRCRVAEAALTLADEIARVDA